jgi:hypothetical protein
MSDRYISNLEIGCERSTESTNSSSKDMKKFDEEDNMIASDSASGSTGGDSKLTTDFPHRLESRDFKFRPTQVSLYFVCHVQISHCESNTWF